MTDRDPDLELSAEERAFHERLSVAVRALPRERPETAFRAHVRARFVADGARAAAGERAARPVARRATIFGFPRLELAVAVAAAITILGVAAIAFNPGPRWQVASGQHADGNVIIDDEPVPAGDIASLNESLLPGSHIEWQGNAELMLHSDGGVVIAILPGSDVRLPEPPPRWFARHTAGRVERGEIRITTGPRFRGARFTLSTPEAAIEVTGTTLAVICEPATTCVCVFDGKVNVRPWTGPGVDVPAGRRQTLHSDGRTSEQADMRPVERGALARMREAMHPLLGGD